MHKRGRVRQVNASEDVGDGEDEDGADQACISSASPKNGGWAYVIW